MPSNIVPAVLRHNTALTAGALVRAAGPNSPVGQGAMDIHNKAINGEYTNPIQVAADVFSLHHNVGKDASPQIQEGIMNVMKASELANKLPMFNINNLQESGAHPLILDAATVANHQMSHGVDPETLTQSNQQVSTTQEG